MQLNGMTAPTTITSQEAKKKEGIGKSEMTQQDFLNLLVEQLKNQDPLNPTDNADFMAQTTAFSQLDALQSMNTNMQTMLEMMMQQTSGGTSLFNAASFIGKEIEFSTNTVTVGDGSTSNISFYLPSLPAAGKTEIRVYNEAGELVSQIRPDVKDLQKGSNVINWDGKGVGGTSVPDGVYSFEVVAFGGDGKKIAVEAYGKAVVQGIKEVGGKLYFDIGDGVVSSEYVYAVGNPTPKDEEGDKDEKPDKPESDKKMARQNIYGRTI